MESLRRIKEVVKEVPQGLECGLGSEFALWKEGDKIEAFGAASSASRFLSASCAAAAAAPPPRRLKLNHGVDARSANRGPSLRLVSFRPRRGGGEEGGAACGDDGRGRGRAQGLIIRYAAAVARASSAGASAGCCWSARAVRLRCGTCRTERTFRVAIVRCSAFRKEGCGRSAPRLRFTGGSSAMAASFEPSSTLFVCLRLLSVVLQPGNVNTGLLRTPPKVTSHIRHTQQICHLMRREYSMRPFAILGRHHNPSRVCVELLLLPLVGWMR